MFICKPLPSLGEFILEDRPYAFYTEDKTTRFITTSTQRMNWLLSTTLENLGFAILGAVYCQFWHRNKNSCRGNSAGAAGRSSITCCETLSTSCSSYRLSTTMTVSTAYSEYGHRKKASPWSDTTNDKFN